MKIISFIVLLALAGARAEQPAGEVAAKYGPDEVEVRLRDGACLRGTLHGLDSLALKTSFGVLKFPATELCKIEHGGDASNVSGAQIAAALKDLESAERAKRDAAGETLLAAGSGCVEALFDARAKASPETKRRIDALLKRVLGAEEKTHGADVVRALRLQAQGTLEWSSFSLKTKVGELTLKPDEVESVLWLARGQAKTMDLPLTEALTDWIDTGITVSNGEAITVTCTGSYNLFNSPGGPGGIRNWNSRPFPAGALIAKIGEGNPVLIGSSKKFTADGSQRLFLKLFAAPDLLQRLANEPPTGKLDVRIQTGSFAE